ncbi:MAG: peptidoglycan D,D-transpeptidase FtsI family protein [Spirochaetota bacterium]
MDQINDNKPPVPVINRRTRIRFNIIIISLAIIFSGLVIRVGHLMLFNKKILQEPPETAITGERGLILDRKGERLAISLETYSVYARPDEVENKKETAKVVSQILELPYNHVLKLLNTKKPFVWILRQTDVKHSAELENLDIRGLYLQKEYRRYYPFKNLASHIIGFSGIDQKGLEGIEYRFNDILVPQRTGSGNPSSRNYTRGYSVVLTIDRYIQEVMEDELDRAYIQTGASAVTAIAMNPATGEILALSSKPDYDLNNFQQYNEETIRNKAVTDAFEPGSTFKIFIASILLDKGYIKERDKFFCKGSIEVAGSTIRDTGVHGAIDFREVLERSCNVGMVESVSRIGNEELYENLRAFGFGTLTGIDLPGETRGILRNPKEWSRVSRYTIAIGQEVSVTPIQLISAASAIANGGVLMQPRIVKRLEKPDGKTIKEFKPLPIRRVIGEETSKRMLDILMGVLSDRGTGYKARLDGYRIAGKTGTAQIADVKKGGYIEGKFYASFIGFVPVPNPKIVVLVTLDKPVGESYGGQTAAPIFKKIVERIAPYMNILPSFSEVYILKDEE